MEASIIYIPSVNICSSDAPDAARWFFLSQVRVLAENEKVAGSEIVPKKTKQIDAL